MGEGAWIEECVDVAVGVAVIGGWRIVKRREKQKIGVCFGRMSGLKKSWEKEPPVLPSPASGVWALRRNSGRGIAVFGLSGCRVIALHSGLGFLIIKGKNGNITPTALCDT